MNSCRFFAVALGLSLLAHAGCSETSVDVTSSIAAAEIVNSTCPIMGNAVEARDLDPSLVKEWNGKKVGFCCPPCLEEWDELTDSEKAAKLDSPGKGQGDSSHDHGHDDAVDKPGRPQ